MDSRRGHQLKRIMVTLSVMGISNLTATQIHSAVAQEMPCDLRTTQRDLATMVEANWITTVGKGRDTKYTPRIRLVARSMAMDALDMF